MTISLPHCLNSHVIFNRLTGARYFFCFSVSFKWVGGLFSADLVCQTILNYDNIIQLEVKNKSGCKMVKFVIVELIKFDMSTA